MLDMSVTVYENQPKSSRDKLREALTAKFEFEDNNITESSFDKMIKTWIRKDRERMKQTFAGTTKVPTKLNPKDWEALKRYWDDPTTKEKSERMSENRKKSVKNPRLGRHGYARKAAKVVRIFKSLNCLPLSKDLS